MSTSPLAGSFRDPDGHVFEKNGHFFRQVNLSYKQEYDLLINSGLYDELTSQHLLVPHSELRFKPRDQDRTYKIIKPEQIGFISYPYEWCFSQLKDAALVTLEVQRIALRYGMSLKDASSYNVQFQGPKPVFIDTLSFGKLEEGKPWIAYRQFCKHFVSPLAIMSYKDIRLSQMLRAYLDGLPLNFATRLLPPRSAFNIGITLHLRLHSRAERMFAERDIGDKSGRLFSSKAFYGLIESLHETIEGMKWKADDSTWLRYHDEVAARSVFWDEKKRFVLSAIDTTAPSSVWDLGANSGYLSRAIAARRIKTIAFDNDPACVEYSFLEAKRINEVSLLPLLMDLTNPSASTGWSNSERFSLLQRGPADLVLALALLHHLVIANNVTLTMVAEFFRTICRYLVVEFVPMTDEKARKLIAGRGKLFINYTQENFLKEFKKYFVVMRSESLKDSQRTIYLMRARSQ